MQRLLLLFIFFAITKVSLSQGDELGLQTDSTVITEDEHEKEYIPDFISISPTPLPFDSSYRDNYKGNDFDYSEKEEKDINRSISIPILPALAKILFYLFAIAVGAYLLYFFAKMGSGFFVSREVNYPQNNKIERKNETVTDLNDIKIAINSLKANGEYREAVRLYFQWYLLHLAQTKHIKFDAKKTNTDYKIEMKDKVQKESFKKLSSQFEYVWYGEIQLDKKMFEEIENVFLSNLNIRQD